MFLVCDGGGTKTDFLIFSSTGFVYAFAEKDGTNAIFIDSDEASSRIIAGIEECLKNADLDISDIEKIGLFIPGFSPSIEKVKSHFKRDDIILNPDEKSAFYASLGSPYGIAVLSGTGSFAYGKDYNGNTAEAGGWGPLFGDEGSGYHIGILCLKSLAKIHDEKIEGTILEEVALRDLEIERITDLRKRAYKKDFDRRKIASLTHTVKECAEKGDKLALQILDEAAAALADLAYEVSSDLSFAPLPVALVGGTRNIGELFTNKVKAEIEQKVPNLKFLEGLYSPITGAALCLLHEYLGLDITKDIAENLENKRKRAKC